MDKAEIRDTDLNGGAVLVVQLPVGSELELRETREYILDSLEAGAVVLPMGTQYKVERFPPLGMVRAEPALPGKDAEEKRAILARLKGYREKNGLGCFKRLARGRLTEEMIRGALTGATPLTIQQWRSIGRALDRVEQGEDAGE